MTSYLLALRGVVGGAFSDTPTPTSLYMFHICSIELFFRRGMAHRNRMIAHHNRI